MQSKVPYLIDVVVDREADCSMGAAIDKVREFV
jgi:glyoxylate carboligase